jgi:DNA-binding CsgD family transcriptional regulator
MRTSLIALFVCFIFHPAAGQAPEEEVINGFDHSVARIRSHDYGQAMIELRRMVASPHDSIQLVNAYQLLIKAAIPLRNYDEALHAIHKAMQLPKLTTASKQELLEDAARIHLALSAPDSAETYSRILLSVQPDSNVTFRALQLLSTAEARQNRYDSAWYHLQRSLQLIQVPKPVIVQPATAGVSVALLAFALLGWGAWLFQRLMRIPNTDNPPDKTGTSIEVPDLQQEILQLRLELKRFKDAEMEQLKSRLLSPHRDEDAYWKDFLLFFARVHPDFCHRLKSTYPTISTHELRLCALIKLNLSNQEISKALYITMDSVRKARYRIYKKMGLDSDLMFSEFLIQF